MNQFAVMGAPLMAFPLIVFPVMVAAPLDSLGRNLLMFHSLPWMRGMRSAILLAAPVLVGASLSSAQGQRDRVEYVEKTEYVLIDEMLKNNDELRAAAKKKTEEILKAIKEESAAREKSERELRVDTSEIWRPEGPGAFAQSWHFPPTPQYLTGTCWSFASTSFLEAEMKRLHGLEMKLSEMWTAYWEYVDKAQGWIDRRGKSEFGEGSQTNAFQRVWIKHGIVPRSVYEGCLAQDGRFNHDSMHHAMHEFLKWCEAQNFWEEDIILGTIRSILDQTMGRPPETFEWDGKSITPKEFLSDVCKLVPGDYVAVMSRMNKPYFEKGTFEVPDNWWFDSSYINVPLETWYEVFASTLSQGGSLVIGGDVSEPGLYGKEDIAFIPSFDVPKALIDQSAREFRIENGTTTDDHAVHIVGYLRHQEDDWFLIKDSNRSSRLGRHKGYYMYRGDYLKLKMLTLGVHKSFVPAILEKAGAASAASEE